MLRLVTKRGLLESLAPQNLALATGLALALSSSLSQAQSTGVVYVDDLQQQALHQAAYSSNMPAPVASSNQGYASRYPLSAPQPTAVTQQLAMPQYGQVQQASYSETMAARAARAGSASPAATTQQSKSSNSSLQLRSTAKDNQPRSLFQLWGLTSKKTDSGQQAASRTASSTQKPAAWSNKSHTQISQSQTDTAKNATLASHPTSVAKSNMPLPMSTSQPLVMSPMAAPAPSAKSTPVEPAGVAMVSDQSDLGVKLASTTKPSAEPRQAPLPTVEVTPMTSRPAETPLKLATLPTAKPAVATPAKVEAPAKVQPQQIVNQHVAANQAKPRVEVVAKTQSTKVHLSPAEVGKQDAREAVAAMPSNPVAPPQPVAEKPSQKSVELLSEANQLAASATTEEDYTAVVQACRHVLAIENAPVAVAYSHDLASWALNRRGELKTDQGRIKEALLDFNDALRLDPKRYRAIHNRGVLAAQAGRFADAFDDFNKTIELNPEYAKAYSNRGALYVQAGEMQKASADYRQAIALDPDLAVAHKGRGRVCHLLGQFELALQHLDAAARLAPEDARIVNNRGDLLSDMGRYRGAMTDYQTAIQLAPAFADAQRSLAWLYATCPDRECRNPSQALVLAKHAMEMASDPNDLDYDTLAAALAANGDYQTAVSMMDKALERSNDQDRSNYEWRRQLYAQGQPYVCEPAGNVQQAAYVQ